MTDENAKKKPETPNPFDPEKLRISGDIHQVGAERLLLRIPVRKPSKQEFFRVNPAPRFRLTCAILELKDEREFHLVTPDFVQAIPEDIRHVELRLCVSRQGTIFLWPVPMAGPDGRTNTWHESAREGAQQAEIDWVRLVASMSEGCYTIYRALGDIPEPKWPDKSLQELITLAFGGGRLIDSVDHPVIRRLNGE